MWDVTRTPFGKKPSRRSSSDSAHSARGRTGSAHHEAAQPAAQTAPAKSHVPRGDLGSKRIAGPQLLLLCCGFLLSLGQWADAKVADRPARLPGRDPERLTCPALDPGRNL